MMRLALQDGAQGINQEEPAVSGRDSTRHARLISRKVSVREYLGIARVKIISKVGAHRVRLLFNATPYVALNRMMAAMTELLTAPRQSWVFRDRLEGSLTGLLVGDALGVPYEFKRPEDLPPTNLIEYEPPAGFPRSHSRVPPGTWSDDGAQALVLLDTLLCRGHVDLAHLGRGLVRWAKEGFCAVDGHIFDIGIQTRAAIDRMLAGTAPAISGLGEEWDNGNGSLMRVLPLALWHQGSDVELAADAARQSMPTHAHVRSMAACALYCLYVRAILAEVEQPWEMASKGLRTLAAAERCFPEAEVALLLDPRNAAMAKGTGYVVDTLWAARNAFEASTDFEGCMRLAISLGHDTDTVAAVAGGLAGAHYGLAGIPERWLHGLRGQEILRPLMQQLLDQRQGSRQAITSKPRTSATHPLRIDSLPLLRGRLGLTLCPGKKQKFAVSGTWDRDLDTDLAAMRAWGATELVTLIEDHEFDELSVTALPERAQAHGFHWHHLPIQDQRAPDAGFERLWLSTLPSLKGALERGEGVVLHCKGGLGRAGTVAARMLLELHPELSVDEVFRLIREVRPGAIESRAQECYLEGLPS